jgi:hypothetical protein
MIIATIDPDTRGVRTGTRVYWHGTFPDINKKGTVTLSTRPGDIRVSVAWDSRPNNPSLEWVTAIARVIDHRRCDCGRCGGTGRGGA